MDAEMERSALQEIAHIVLDAQEKVSVRRVSNTWNVSFADAITLLEKWVDGQKDGSKLSKEYLVRGLDSKGNAFVTVANEKKRKTIEKLSKECCARLYAVDLASASKSLNISADHDFNVVTLRLNPETRSVKSVPAVQPEPATSATVKAVSNPKGHSMFANVKTVAKTVAPAKETHKSSTTPPAAVAEGKPKASPPPKKDSPKKQSPKKDAKKPTAGKGSIASFFSSKQVNGNTPVKPASASEGKSDPVTPVVAPAKNKITTPRMPENERKRTISVESDEDVVPNTPQEVKKKDTKKSGKATKLRKVVTNPSKKSRILQICDSSSDEDDRAVERNGNHNDEAPERLVQFDDDVDEEMAEPAPKAKSVSPEKPVENDSNSANRNRTKVRKAVTKTFMDEEGYLNTMKDYEMVSEDEQEVVKQDSKKDKISDTSATAKPAVVPASKATKVTPPTPKTKQGSIMSFFAKK